MRPLLITTRGNPSRLGQWSLDEGDKGPDPLLTGRGSDPILTGRRQDPRLTGFGPHPEKTEVDIGPLPTTEDQLPLLPTPNPWSTTQLNVLPRKIRISKY